MANTHTYNRTIHIFDIEAALLEASNPHCSCHGSVATTDVWIWNLFFHKRGVKIILQGLTKTSKLCLKAK